MRFTPILLAATLALSADQAAGGLAQVLPAGKFSARDGRPGPGKHWQLTDAQGAALAARLNEVAAKTPISIDYEHQSVLAPTNGQAAPAAGWMVHFDWRAGAGMFATVNWTPRAKAYIAADEYRYISPVILFDQATGDVVGLHNCALVANPAILGMSAVQAALSAQAATAESTELLPHANLQKGTPMDLITLVALLGLSAGATLADATAFITTMMARPVVPAALSTALGLPATADEAAAVAALSAALAKLAAPDAASAQAMLALQTQLATLQSEVTDRKVLEVVDAAVVANKIVPAQRDWAMKLGKADMAQLNAFLASAPAIPGLSGQTRGRGDPPAGAGNDDPQGIARDALALQASQAGLGIRLSTPEAVDQVMATRAAAR